MEFTNTGTTYELDKLTNFLPKQLTAWEAMWLHRYVLYGGARGPGKSYWLRWSLFTLHLYWFMKLGLRDVQTGLFCETYPELQDRQINKIDKEFPLEFGEVKSTLERGLGFHFHERWGGGTITLRNLDKPSKYQSAEFAAIAVDELTKIVKNTFDILRGSLRWPGVPRTVFLGATNPGGVGHLFVKDLWVDKNFAAFPELDQLKDEFAFIKALPKDNPYLPESYWDELNSLPPQLYKAWVEGNWDAFVGQVFTEWIRDRHVCKPFKIPSHWPKWRAIDWGYAAPFCCLWLAKNPDNGRQYVYREIYVKELTDKQQAVAIFENTPPEEQVQVTYADPSMWSRKNMEGKVTTTAQEYAQNGVSLAQADNDRLGGKRKVHRALANLPDGEPGLMVFENCVNLIRTLPALPYDEIVVEDVDTDAEDHGYDALRYGLTRMVDPKKELDKAQGGSGRPQHNLSGLSDVL